MLMLVLTKRFGDTFDMVPERTEPRAHIVYFVTTCPSLAAIVDDVVSDLVRRQ